MTNNQSSHMLQFWYPQVPCNFLPFCDILFSTGQLGVPKSEVTFFQQNSKINNKIRVLSWSVRFYCHKVLQSGSFNISVALVDPNFSLAWWQAFLYISLLWTLFFHIVFPGQVTKTAQVCCHFVQPAGEMLLRALQLRINAQFQSPDLWLGGVTVIFMLCLGGARAVVYEVPQVLQYLVVPRTALLTKGQDCHCWQPLNNLRPTFYATKSPNTPL